MMMTSVVALHIVALTRLIEHHHATVSVISIYLGNALYSTSGPESLRPLPTNVP